MTTLSSVIETLKEINENQEGSSDRRSEELKMVFSDGIKELARSIESSRGSGLRLPSLSSITSIITNNPISKAIGAIKDTITNAITAPYRLLTGAINGITSTFSSIFSILGSFIMAPFNMLKNLIFPSAGKGDKESIKLLNEISLGIRNLNLTFESYIDYLKNQRLDDLETSRERGNPPPERSDPDRGPLPPQSDTNRISILALRAIAALPVIELLAELGLALAIEALGLDDFVKALKLPDLFRGIKGTFTKISGFFTSVVDLFKKIKLPDLPNLNILGRVTDFFKGLKLPDLPNLDLSSRFADLFKKIKLPDLPNLRLPSLPGFNLDLPNFSKYLDPLKSFFTGVGKFFSGAFDIFKPLLTPIKAATKLLKGLPFVGWVLTAFDGLFGAIKGFTETDGSLTDKLWGAFDGAIMGIITGITDAIDLLAIKIPAWFLEKLGFEGAAEKLREFSLTTLVENLWKSIKGLFNGGIDGLTTTLKNIPDYLYMAAQKYLKISIPEISIKLPNFLGGGKFTLIPAFSVGFGSDQGAAQAKQNITRRNEELIQRRRTTDEEANRVLERSQVRLSEASDRLNSSRMAAIQNNVDARQTQNNTTVMNQGAFPLPVDVRDPVRGPI